MAKHGGAWKVAYADFITAMMALFMVLWILGTEQELLDQIQEYFRNPPSPFDRQTGKFVVEMGEFSGRSAEDLSETFFDSADPALLQAIMREFHRVLDLQTTRDIPPPVEITVTSDGLRLIIFDRQDTALFRSGESKFTEWGSFLIQNLSWLLSRYRFSVVIASHSGELDQARPEVFDRDFGHWELSTDRAQRIRRAMVFYSRGDVNVLRVSGYGDSRPLDSRTPGRTHQRVVLSLSISSPIDLAPEGASPDRSLLKDLPEAENL